MKISVVYVSQSGNTETAAEFIVDGILAKYPFIQVKRMDIREKEVDLELLKASDAVGIAKCLDESEKEFEDFGAAVAEKLIRTGIQKNPDRTV